MHLFHGGTNVHADQMVLSNLNTGHDDGPNPIAGHLVLAHWAFRLGGCGSIRSRRRTVIPHGPLPLVAALMSPSLSLSQHFQRFYILSLTKYRVYQISN
jgi:hypothetical protein